MRRPLSALFLLATLWALNACTDDPLQANEALALSECRIEGFGGFTRTKALCGELIVPLDPATPDGATVTLFVAKVPALSRAAADSAFTIIAGGPGQASTQAYASLRGAFERVRRERDIILIDQRGTGKSNAQACEFDDTDADLSNYSPAQVRALAQQCLDTLGDDTRFYTTSLAVRDLDQLRAALGYDTLDIYGVSYGTRVAQHYLRQYPQHTRTVVLDGVVPVDVPLGPAIATDAQRALDLIFSRCINDSDCHVAFGDIERKFTRLLERTQTAPIALEFVDPISGERSLDDFGYTDLLMAVRLMSYSPETAALLPYMINEADQGNLQPLAAQALLNAENLGTMLAYGMHNSVVCTEDVPFYTEEGIDRSTLMNAYMGDLSYQSLIETCTVWPSGPIDDGFTKPFASDVPVLVLSGEVDPVTPPAYGDRAARYLGNARAITLPGQGHGQIQLGCMPTLLATFVSTADHAALDIECLDVQQPAPFFISPSGSAP
ncbi:MAG: alpha/beta hydrolase [Pseudomonadota bacterium]